mmetsp:Transcript_11979/g.13626  ORF Transcript_11979/g.13626 Transcript_11979/m.13626 type:complete len:176 (-) Transcript_11979:864-1391(-)
MLTCLNYNTLQELHKIIKLKPKGATPIICGDFNAQIGIAETSNPNTLHADTQHILGPYRNSRVNDRGQILLNFLLEHGFCVPSTFLRGKKGHDTWFSQKGTPHQINHILIPRHKVEQEKAPRSSPDYNAIRASKDSINDFHERFTEVLTKENLQTPIPSLDQTGSLTGRNFYCQQ